jgi:hypothetical protein
MTGPTEIRLPASPEWGFVAQSVILSVASALGAPSSVLAELGMACAAVWDEVVATGGVEEAYVETSGTAGELRLVVVGVGRELLPQDGGWASPVSAAIMRQIARHDSIERSQDRVRIEVGLSLDGRR